MNPQQRIIDIIRREYDKATESYRHAHADRVGIDAAANAWDEFNKNDGIGGFSTNPHNTIRASNKEQDAKLYYENMKEAYSFAVDTFIQPEPPKIFIDPRTSDCIKPYCCNGNSHPPMEDEE